MVSDEYERALIPLDQGVRDAAKIRCSEELADT